MEKKIFEKVFLNKKKKNFLVVYKKRYFLTFIISFSSCSKKFLLSVSNGFMRSRCSSCRHASRAMSQGDIHLHDIQLLWRRANNQSPATSPTMISGYRTILNPLLQVFKLTVILIPLATAEPYLYKPEAVHPLHLLQSLTMMKGSTTQNW